MASQVETLMQSSEYMMRREKIQREINRSVIKPTSFEIFEKSQSEKSQIKRIKKAHNEMLRENGFDPKKRINLNEPMRIR